MEHNIPALLIEGLWWLCGREPAGEHPTPHALDDDP
jgi:hypothetical protein